MNQCYKKTPVQLPVSDLIVFVLTSTSKVGFDFWTQEKNYNMD